MGSRRDNAYKIYQMLKGFVISEKELSDILGIPPYKLSKLVRILEREFKVRKVKLGRNVWLVFK